MGKVRCREFYAVIGVGGLRPDRGSEEISRKLNWIGIGASRTGQFGDDGFPIIEFKRFIVLEEHGPELRFASPSLYRRMCKRYGPRTGNVWQTMVDRIGMPHPNDFQGGQANGVISELL